jgi:heme exporter protein A
LRGRDISLVPDSTNTAYADVDRRAPGEDAATRPAVEARAALSTPAVELFDVAQRLGGRWALRGVTLQVRTGEVAAIVGPNGSGKTTLLRVVGTALTPTRGSGRVFGRDLVGDANGVREVTGMLGHATGLYDDLTAAENLAFALRMHGQAPSRTSVDSALDMVGMLRHASDRVRDLSSGMQRRVALARVLLRRPRLLLLDEPYNSVDVSGVAIVDSMIRETVRAGGSALVVTHDLTQVAGGGFDRVVSLNAGRVERTT